MRTCDVQVFDHLEWVFSVSCAEGIGLCVSEKHGVFILAVQHRGVVASLDVHSLADGSRVRSYGSKGNGNGQFFAHHGGMCLSPDGDSFLIADCFNKRVQHNWIADGSWVRSIGEGRLQYPQYVDCNSTTIVVSEDCHRISVLEWSTGELSAQFAACCTPKGIRLLATGTELVVANSSSNGLCVYTLEGKLTRRIGERRLSLRHPEDVVECVSDGSFIVATSSSSLVKLSESGDGHLKILGRAEGVDTPCTLALLSTGGLLVRSKGRGQVQLSRGGERR
jgi:hypothetical protein